MSVCTTSFPQQRIVCLQILSGLHCCLQSPQITYFVPNSLQTQELPSSQYIKVNRTFEFPYRLGENMSVTTMKSLKYFSISLPMAVNVCWDVTFPDKHIFASTKEVQYWNRVQRSRRLNTLMNCACTNCCTLAILYKYTSVNMRVKTFQKACLDNSLTMFAVSMCSTK